MRERFDVAVIGAGIAGVSAAYHLAVRRGPMTVALIDPRPPLTLTSDKSTECYRNWWPDAEMVGLMNRSIDVFDELATEFDFGLNRRGYLFVTADERRLAALADQQRTATGLGAEAEVLDEAELRSRHPFVTDHAVGGVFVPRAGWMRATDLGQWMLERARDSGTALIQASVVGLEPGELTLDDGEKIGADHIVIAAGPMSAEVAALAELDLPLFSELHLKVAYRDHLGVIPRDAPMTIWADPQRIDWTAEETAELEAMGRQDVLGEMPIFCHFRPEGGPESPYFVALWEYHDSVTDPVWPLPEDLLYPEVVLRGLATMVPDLSVYRDRLPEAHVDGGYYTKTRENRPLVGPSEVEGIHLMAGMSGFGVMVSAGAADLLACQITGDTPPWYAPAFLIDRYQDPEYLARLESVDSGQL